MRLLRKRFRGSNKKPFSFILKPGKRVTIIARTGSGKTQLARKIMYDSHMLFVVLNPKNSDDFTGMGNIGTVDGLDLDKVKSIIDSSISKGQVGHVDVRPLPTDKYKEMDDFILSLHNTYKNIGLLIDELYTVHTPRGEHGPGLTAWLTRGRARNQSYIGLSQRPRKISLFCLSESDYLIKMHLNLKEDRRYLATNTTEHFKDNLKTPYAWQFYDISKDEYHQLMPIKPMNTKTVHQSLTGDKNGT